MRNIQDTSKVAWNFNIIIVQSDNTITPKFCT